MAYPTAADLAQASEVPDLQAMSPETLEEIRLLSIKAVEGFCGQKFIEETGVRTFDSAGGRTLALTQRLATLTTLTVAGSSLQASDVVLNEKRSELSVLVEAGGGNWVERVLREDQPPLFRAGVGTVTIDGVWGWTDAELPADDLTTPIAVALRMDMEDQALLRSGPLSETTRVMAKARSDLLIEGPLRLSTSQSIIPLSSEVQTLLDDYVWQPVARVT